MADDFKANVRTTGSVAVGGETAGVIGKKNDVDWFAVELVPGRTYVIDLEGDGGGALDAMLRGLYDGAGKRIAGTRNQDGGEGSNAQLSFTATEDGTHYIAARGQGGTTGAYTVRVTEMDPDATPAGAADLGDLAGQDGARVHRDAVDGAADGADYYRFTLSEARTVKLALRGQEADADLYLEDADGNVLASSTRGGTRNERIEETLAAGTYYVRMVSQEAGENDYALRYRATEPPRKPAPPENVSEPHGEDFPADTSTPGRVAVGGAVTGALTAHDAGGYWRGFEWIPDPGGDVDWYAMELTAGTTYRIDLRGESSGHGTLYDPILHDLRDAQGQRIPGTGNRDGGAGSDSLIWFTPTESGTYYAVVGAGSGFPLNIGSYTLSVAAIADDLGAGAGTAGRVEVGGTATGTMDSPLDRDWFAVELEAGKLYRVEATGELGPQGPGERLYLGGIFDDAGDLVPGTGAYHDRRYGNAGTWFTPEESGTYYVEAFSPTGRVGGYAVAVREVVDDFSHDATTSGRIAVGGTATGEIEVRHRDDRDWFAVEFEAGKTYAIDLMGRMNGGGTLGASTVSVYLDGFCEGWSPGGAAPGVPHRLSFTADRDATYYVQVDSVDFNSWGTYTLAVDELADTM